MIEFLIALAIMIPILTCVYMKNHWPVWATHKERQHIKKEKRLLNNLIKDVRANTGHWVRNAHCPMTFQGPMLVNDHSKIAIRYSLTGDTTPEMLMIHFNLKNLLKFDQTCPDSICTRICGKHAQKFINTVTDILDERGKELDYITTQIKERL